jgi:hypothetical protein
MNQTQQGIVWIGLAVVLIFLFTDADFRNALFNRGSEKTTVSSPFTTAQLESAFQITASTGLPSSSNTGKGTVTVV